MQTDTEFGGKKLFAFTPSLFASRPDKSLISALQRKLFEQFIRYLTLDKGEKIETEGK